MATTEKQFQAVARAVVATGLLAYADYSNNAVLVESGWWNDEKKARAELNAMLERSLTPGCYHIGMIIKERVYAL